MTTQQYKLTPLIRQRKYSVSLIFIVEGDRQKFSIYSSTVHIFVAWGKITRKHFLWGAAWPIITTFLLQSTQCTLTLTVLHWMGSFTDLQWYASSFEIDVLCNHWPFCASKPCPKLPNIWGCDEVLWAETSATNWLIVYSGFSIIRTAWCH